LNEFINRLKDVWDAIKQENFIFGFKNSQAIEVYADVQKKYNNLVAKVRGQLFDLSYQLSEKHSKITQELMDGPACFANYKKDIDSSLVPKIGEWEREVIEDLRGFIEAKSNPEMASHHLCPFQMDFKKKTQLWLHGEISNMRIKILSICKKEKTSAFKRKEYKEKCLLKVINQAEELKKGPGDYVLEKNVIEAAFEEMYFTWLEGAQSDDQETLGTMQILFDVIWQNSHKCLYDKLSMLNFKNYKVEVQGIHECWAKLKNARPNDPNNFYLDFDPQNHLKLSVMNYMTGIPESTSDQAHKRKNYILQTMKDIINESKKKVARHFSSQAIIEEIMDKANSDIACSNIGEYQFTKEFRRNFLILIFANSVKKMETIQKDDWSKYSMVTFLENKKCELYREFEEECMAADCLVRAASRLVKKILTPILISQVKRSIGSIIYTTVVGKEELGQKNTMMFHLQKELLNLPFNMVKFFVTDFHGYVKCWISERITDICLENTFLQKQITNRIKSDISSLIDILRVLAIPISQSQMTSTRWWQTLTSRIIDLGFVFQVLKKNIKIALIKVFKRQRNNLYC
jgi:hypothetical protein